MVEIEYKKDDIIKFKTLQNFRVMKVEKDHGYLVCEEPGSTLKPMGVYFFSISFLKDQLRRRLIFKN